MAGEPRRARNSTSVKRLPEVSSGQQYDRTSLHFLLLAIPADQMIRSQHEQNLESRLQPHAEVRQ